MTKQDWTGQRIELEVGPVAHGGHCVARYEGRVVFVRHALPGEVVVAEVTEDGGGSFCRADAVEVRTASPERVAPPCPLADMALGRDRCGGCDWQHASHAEQRRLKSDVVTEQLRRIGGIDHPVEVHELPGGPLRWRTRVRLAVDESGRPGFRAHRSHRVIPVADCPITVADTVEPLAAEQWRPGTELAVARDGDDEVHVSVRHRRNVRLVRGSGVAHEQAAGRRWALRTTEFWQVHHAAAETFAATVGELAAAPSGGVAWDLYGGAGLFTAVLAEQVGSSGKVLLVESAKDAVRDARTNLADYTQVRYKVGDVTKVIGQGTPPRPDVVVLDPPRKGAGRTVVEATAAHRPSRVVHVACDPAALARDVRLFQDNGYRLSRIEAFDAFPMTHHIECIALLELAE